MQAYSNRRGSLGQTGTVWCHGTFRKPLANEVGSDEGWNSLGRNLHKGLGRDCLSGKQVRIRGTGTEAGAKRENPE